MLTHEVCWLGQSNTCEKGGLPSQSSLGNQLAVRCCSLQTKCFLAEFVHGHNAERHKQQVDSLIDQAACLNQAFDVPDILLCQADLPVPHDAESSDNRLAEAVVPALAAGSMEQLK